MKRILVVGACGQIGTELVIALRNRFGKDNVIASDIKKSNHSVFDEGHFVELDIMDGQKLKSIVESNNITDVYLLAALLSATAEKNPRFAWDLNMEGLFNVLNLAKDKIIEKVFWPSSIAVFGPSTPKNHTPQVTFMEPSTVYGISKLAGERWCEYYASNFDVDVRSIRYPGLISYGAEPGGGTTDYAVDIFYKAKRGQSFECFLSEGTSLPMMYMEDAINATISLMEAPNVDISVRSSYNVAGLSFTPKEIYEEIKKHIPDFRVEYTPDFRQKIADSWPSSIDDTMAKTDWNWEPKYGLSDMVEDMLDNILVN